MPRASRAYTFAERLSSSLDRGQSITRPPAVQREPITRPTPGVASVASIWGSFSGGCEPSASISMIVS